MSTCKEDIFSMNGKGQGQNNQNQSNSNNNSGIDSGTSSTISEIPNPNSLDDSIQIIGSDDDETITGKPLPKYNSKVKLFYKFLRYDKMVTQMKYAYENCEMCEKEHFKEIFQISCPTVLPSEWQRCNSERTSMITALDRIRGQNSSEPSPPKRSLSSPNNLPSINLSGSPNQMDKINKSRSGRSAKEKAKIMNQNVLD